MLRLQLAMSIVPLMSAAMPSPEPPPETSISTFGACFLYSSAQAWARFTMVSEPLFWMVTTSPEVLPTGFDPQPERDRPITRLERERTRMD